MRPLGVPLRVVALAAHAALATAACGADVEDAFARATRTPEAAIVAIATTGCPPQTANGTGVLVADRLVLTAAHVLRGVAQPDDMKIVAGGREVHGTIVAFDPEMDLAYIRLAEGAASAVAAEPLRRARTRVGDSTAATAYVVRDGAVVALPTVVQRAVNIRTEDIYIEGETNRPGYVVTAVTKAGDSGGPVVVDGEVIGILSLHSREVDDRAYPIDPWRAGGLIDRQLRTGDLTGVDVSRCY